MLPFFVGNYHKQQELLQKGYAYSNPKGKSRELHKVKTATVGFVQHSFHCSACGRNETLVISGCPSSSVCCQVFVCRGLCGCEVLFFEAEEIFCFLIFVRLAKKHTLFAALVCVSACSGCKMCMLLCVGLLYFYCPLNGRKSLFYLLQSL